MRREFVIDDFRVQTAWDWRIAFYLFLSGASGGLIFVEIVLRIFDVINESTATVGAWAGMALASLSLLVLFTHLGAGRARWRFSNVFMNLRHSWISRGATVVTLLMALRLVFLLPSIWEGLPWGEGTIAGSSLRGAIMVLAVAFMAYSGLVLSWWKSIPFWNTPLIPALYIGYSFLGGAASLPVITLVTEGRDGLNSAASVFWPVLLGLLVANGVGLFVYMWGMASRSLSARESVRRLVRGGTHWSWWAGVVGVGLAAPTLIVLLATVDVLGTSIAATSVVIAACLAILAGGYLLRYCVLKVGVYVTLMER
jgi:protein NrfD